MGAPELGPAAAKTCASFPCRYRMPRRSKRLRRQSNLERRRTPPSEPMSDVDAAHSP